MKKLSSMTRAERSSRRERDTGQPQDRVWFGEGRKCLAYHDNPDCFRLSGDKATTREAAQRRWLAPCGHCVGLSGGANE